MAEYPLGWVLLPSCHQLVFLFPLSSSVIARPRPGEDSKVHSEVSSLRVVLLFASSSLRLPIRSHYTGCHVCPFPVRPPAVGLPHEVCGVVLDAPAGSDAGSTGSAQRERCCPGSGHGFLSLQCGGDVLAVSRETARCPDRCTGQTCHPKRLRRQRLYSYITGYCSEKQFTTVTHMHRLGIPILVGTLH